MQDVARGIGLENRIGSKFLPAGPGRFINRNFMALQGSDFSSIPSSNLPRFIAQFLQDQTLALMKQISAAGHQADSANEFVDRGSTHVAWLKTSDRLLPRDFSEARLAVASALNAARLRTPSFR